MRSPGRRAALIAAGVVTVSAATAFQLGEMYEAFGRPRGFDELFVREFSEWAIWGVLAVPIVRAAIAIVSWSRGLLTLVAAQLLFAGVVAVAATALEDVFDDAYDDYFDGRRERATAEQRDDRDARRERDGDEGDDEAERARRSAWRSSRFAMHAARNALVHTAILGVGLAIAATLRARDASRRSADLELTTTRLEVELGAARMAALRRQLRPHFLLNALHAVGGLVRQGRGAEVQQVLAGLGALLRTSLRTDGDATTSLADELELARHYLDIEAIRLGDRLGVRISSVDGELASTRVPSLLLLPLIENAVHHGVAPREEGGTVSIDVTAEGDEVVIVVRDDGPGFPDEVLAGAARDDDAGPGSGSSIGLSNTRARIALTAGASMRLDNDGGARVTLRLPRGGARR